VTPPVAELAVVMAPIESSPTQPPETMGGGQHHPPASPSPLVARCVCPAREQAGPIHQQTPIPNHHLTTMDPHLWSNFIALFIQMKEHAASSESHWLDLPRHRATAKAFAERNLHRIPASAFYKLRHDFLEFYCLALGYPEYKPAIGPTRCFDRYGLLNDIMAHRAAIMREPIRRERSHDDQLLTKGNLPSAGCPLSDDEVVDASPCQPTHSPDTPSPPELRIPSIRVPSNPDQSGGGPALVPPRGEKSSTAPSPLPPSLITKRDLLHYSAGDYVKYLKGRVILWCLSLMPWMPSSPRMTTHPLPTKLIVLMPSHTLPSCINHFSISWLMTSSSSIGKGSLQFASPTTSRSIAAQSIKTSSTISC
jgi:hypothetical protein